VKNKRRRLPAASVINFPRFVAAECIALGSRTVHSTRWSQILAANQDLPYPTCIQRPRFRRSPSEYCHNVWYIKTNMVWLPDVKKARGYDYYYSFWQNPRTWGTDRRTDGHRMTAQAALMHSIARQELSVRECLSWATALNVTTCPYCGFNWLLWYFNEKKLTNRCYNKTAESTASNRISWIIYVMAQHVRSGQDTH